ncbi:yhr138c-like protein [Diplodia corticola]|uniref:Yhr138c-like protein n=1 Tax=Diplodia corticola TaxID=236234 RepID=A0A1J9QN81_9PEZI|nr:yhr138c-like protein [Diplodia corticola]OJD29522.1 yhr138c-like protein [Diplodia corticola]
MKLFIFSLLLAMLAACVVGSAPKKMVLVSADSPSVIDHAIQWIEQEKGAVVHKYSLIHAFLAEAPASVFEKAKETFTTNNWGNLVMEEDQEVHAWSESSN